MRNEGFGCIYRIWNKVDGKSYIGQTIDVKHRIKAHFNPKSKCPYLRDAIAKHGKAAFEWEILDTNIPADDLDKREKEYIRIYNSLAPHGYNLTQGNDESKKWLRSM